ncbi:hypothetical protein ElyMa_006091900 [Elysia marginata]|uniref:Uncharacterized protein n=1 Tax=Elysia marginata TaxID=1093978 RepID=A0AAV4GR98_9GAST|nr:hypothetical protein ElyMa_006091900 [Elysia marginata]
MEAGDSEFLYRDDIKKSLQEGKEDKRLTYSLQFDDFPVPKEIKNMAFFRPAKALRVQTTRGAEPSIPWVQSQPPKAPQTPQIRQQLGLPHFDENYGSIVSGKQLSGPKFTFLASFKDENIRSHSLLPHMMKRPLSSVWKPQFAKRSNRALADSTLTHKKNRGGLIFGSYDFLQVVKAADRSLRRLLITAKGGPLSSVPSMTTCLVTLEATETQRTKVFIGLNQHSSDHHRIADDVDHMAYLTDCKGNIDTFFCKNVLNHHGRLHTERFIHKSQGSVRHKLTKNIPFLHIVFAWSNTKC